MAFFFIDALTGLLSLKISSNSSSWTVPSQPHVFIVKLDLRSGMGSELTVRPFVSGKNIQTTLKGDSQQSSTDSGDKALDIRRLDRIPQTKDNVGLPADVLHGHWPCELVEQTRRIDRQS